MCITIKPFLKFFRPIAKKAKQDIVCYKIVDVYKTDTELKLYSQHMGFEYELEKLYTTPIIEIRRAMGGSFLGNVGYHSFCHLEDAEYYNYNPLIMHIVECVIPKGSKYYTGKYGDDYNYISNAIIITRIL